MLIFPGCASIEAENVLTAVTKELDALFRENGLNCVCSVNYGIIEVNDRSAADVDVIMRALTNRMRDMGKRVSRAGYRSPPDIAATSPVM